EYVAVGGERRRIEFTKPIFWLQESETQIQFRHGGKIFDTGATHTDWYGYLKSIDTATKSAITTAEYFSIEPGSSLEMVLMTKIMQCPATETEETIRENSQKPAGYKTAYMHVPEKWRQEAME